MQALAPLRNDLAEGPPSGAAVWVQAADGLRLRLGFWPAPAARGTVLLLPGRTEYIEKYGRSAVALVAAGWSVLALDWRGQGLSERLLPDPMLGHVARFADYQLDLDAALGWLDQQGAAFGLGGPKVLLAHSMGGLIGLRAMQRGLGLQAAVFSAPMWGIRIPPWRRPSAAVLSRLQLALPQDLRFAPTATGKNYVLEAPFAGNLLTSDREMWGYLQRHAQAEPRFGLGGPSLRWVREALREARALMAAPVAASAGMPPVPVLVGLGAEEAIVRPAPIRRRLAHWPGAELKVYPKARHELLMERPEIRNDFIAAALATFARADPQA